LTEKLKFAIDNIKFVEDDKESQFATVYIDAFASGDNHHHLRVSEDVLRKTAHTLYEKPLVWMYDDVLDDAGSHDWLEQPCGFLPKDMPMEFRELEDGRIMLSVWGKVWKKYSGKLLEFFKRDSNTKPVSVEMDVFDMAIDEKSGGGDLLDFAYTAITVLGTFVAPAIPGAKADVVAFAKEETKAYKEAYATEFSKVESVAISDEVKETVKKGLELERKHGGGTAVSMALATCLVDSKETSQDKVRQMAEYFSKNKIDVLSERKKAIPSNEYISYLLRGGNEGFKWAEKMTALFDEAEEKRIAHFKNLELSDDSEKTKKEMSMDEKEKDLTPEEEIKPVEMAAEDAPEPEKESPEKEKEEEDEEEMAKDSGKDKGFSTFALDVKAALEFLKEETEDYQKFALALEKPEEERDYAGACEYIYNRMYSQNEKMVEMAKESSVYMAELEGLRQYKTDMEKKDFAFEVNSTLKEVEGIIPEVEMQSLREDSENFDLQNVDGWKNAVKAKAFSYTKRSSENSGIPKIGTPWTTGKPEAEKVTWK